MKTNGRQERNGVIELTRKEIIERIDREAKRRMHMSANELLRSYRAGRLEDAGAVADLLALSNLLPDNDPLFGNGTAA